MHKLIIITLLMLMMSLFTMSVATNSLSDSLPFSIPKLDAVGINWIIFSVHFQDAVEANDFWGHFDGTSTHPVDSSIPGTTTPGGSVSRNVCHDS